MNMFDFQRRAAAIHQQEEDLESLSIPPDVLRLCLETLRGTRHWPRNLNEFVRFLRSEAENLEKAKSISESENGEKT